MKIGIIGAGHIGSTLARKFIQAGHQVFISNSRLPRTLAPLIEELGKNARAVPVGENVLEADLVIEAIPFGKYESLPSVSLADKILVSASNYYPNRDGEIDLKGNSQTGLIAASMLEAKVVKAFNTIYWEHLRDRGNTDLPLDKRRVIPLAGDDPEAKKTVAKLIEAIGFAPLDMGSLEEGGRQMEPGQPIYNNDITLADAKHLLGK